MKPQLIDIDYSYNNLKNYPKDELIALIWRNRQYIEQLEKALDRVDEFLNEISYSGEFEYLCLEHIDDEPENYQGKWKEYFMREDE